MTWTEEHLWKELRKLNVNFRRQAPIGRFFADFASHGAKIVVEVDGGVHERLPQVTLRDFERQQWLESQGYRVVRFTNRQVSDDVYGCAEKVKALLLDGGGLGGGVSAEVMGERSRAPAPNGVLPPRAVHAPPSPALPPSRRKGEEMRPATGPTLSPSKGEGEI